MSSLTRLIRAGLLALCFVVVGVAAHATEWQRGDVIVGIGNGQYQVYRFTTNGEISSYNLIETITDGSGTTSGEHGIGGNGYTAGCAFDSTSHLYTTNFSNTKVYRFSIPDPHTVSQTIDTNATAPGGHSESIVFDGSGNFYVGNADYHPNEGQAIVLKYSPAGSLLSTFTVATEDRGSDWTELSPDGNTLYYTSEGTHIRVFDLVHSTQLSDIPSGEGSLPGSHAYEFRLLPQSIGGGFLVADTEQLIRVDAHGNVVQHYGISTEESTWFAVNLDSNVDLNQNPTSFWAAAFGTGNLYKFNIVTGAIEAGPIATGAIGEDNTSSVGGICVNGAAGAAQSQPFVQTVTLTPTNNTATVSNDNNSNTWQTTLNGLTQNAHVTIAFTEIPQSAGSSDLSGYGACELESADGTKCVVHQISVDTTAYASIDFYHHWSFKPTGPINPRMIKNATTDITTAVYLDPGTKGHTNTPSTYVDNEGPAPTASSCGGFVIPPNGLTWEAEFPLTFVFRAVANGGNCNRGPFLTSLSPVFSLARVDPSGTVTPVTLSSTSFKVFAGVWFYILPTKNLKPGTYVATVLDQSNHIASFSETIKIVPED
jgi:hypothetical protein